MSREFIEDIYSIPGAGHGNRLRLTRQAGVYYLVVNGDGPEGEEATLVLTESQLTGLAAAIGREFSGEVLG